MPDILPFLKSLISVSGLSGDEAPVASLLAGKWRSLVDEVSFSRVGSLHGLKKGSGKFPRPSIMIAAHMDGIGLRVFGIVDGFLRVVKVGSIDRHVLPGAEVTIHATGSHKELPAVVVLPPARSLLESAAQGVPAI